MSKPAAANKPLDKAIGARMRMYRLQRKLSQEAIADELGVTFQQIQKYEKGTNRVSGSRLVKLCDVLHVRPEQILGNGSGVYADQPDALIALQDKDVSRMLVAMNELSRPRRRAVAQCLLLLVKAFQQKL